MSAKTFPPIFPGAKSLSPRRVEATNCLIVCSLVNCCGTFAILGSTLDSKAKYLLCPVGSFGSEIKVNFCCGATRP